MNHEDTKNTKKLESYWPETEFKKPLWMRIVTPILIFDVIVLIFLYIVVVWNIIHPE